MTVENAQRLMLNFGYWNFIWTEYLNDLKVINVEDIQETIRKANNFENRSFNEKRILVDALKNTKVIV